MHILVFQHVATETPGSFREVMTQNGHRWTAVELDEGEPIPPLDGFDALLVMGGPQDAWETDKYPWLLDEMTAIRRWVTAKRPYLGICLGHQLLAQAMGGHVALMPRGPEVGIRHIPVPATDPLFKDVAPLCTAFEWHGAEVQRLPPGAVVLTHNDHCPVQAMRLGQNAYGLQFHMELEPHAAEDWGRLPEYAAALERVRGPGSLPEVQAEVTAHYPPLRRAAQQIFRNFLAIAV